MTTISFFCNQLCTTSRMLYWNYKKFEFYFLGQTSPALPCQIELPFTNPHISVFYKQPIVGIGCVTNLTTKTNQEVHVINLKKSVAVYRNEVAEVHLFVKSRNDEGNLKRNLRMSLPSSLNVVDFISKDDKVC